MLWTWNSQILNGFSAVLMNREVPWMDYQFLNAQNTINDTWHELKKKAHENQMI